MVRSDERIVRLVNAARDARRYFRNAAAGNGCNGRYDDILIGRTLTSVLELFDDYEPCHDADRAEWRTRVAQVPEEAQVRR
jgi:hypothetical protein